MGGDGGAGEVMEVDEVDAWVEEVRQKLLRVDKDG